MKSIIRLFVLCLLIQVVGCQQAQTPPTQAGNNTEKEAVTKPKNIIFLVGDGMGITQITAAMFKSGKKMALERFKHLGFIKTYSADTLITDSAAGATAFSCGKKSYNGAIGVDPDTLPIKTIAEYAHEAGLRTGVVATSSIQHATPASYFAHQKNRYMQEEISEDFLIGTIDVAIGGGKQFFEKRKDGRNLIDSLKAKGYAYGENLDAVSQKLNAGKVVVLAAEDGMPKMLEGRGDFLVKATNFAVEHLSNDKGFFLMVEGSQIDWGGHDNDADYIITEMLDFDQAIAAALEYADKDGNTLVVVTADHETGGFAVEGGVLGERLDTDFSSPHHTADLIPVFAYGPGSEEFQGIYENTAIFDKMMELLSLQQVEMASR